MKPEADCAGLSRFLAPTGSATIRGERGGAIVIPRPATVEQPPEKIFDTIGHALSVVAVATLMETVCGDHRQAQADCGRLGRVAKERDCSPKQQVQRSLNAFVRRALSIQE